MTGKRSGVTNCYFLGLKSKGQQVGATPWSTLSQSYLVGLASLIEHVTGTLSKGRKAGTKRIFEGSRVVSFARATEPYPLASGTGILRCSEQHRVDSEIISVL